MTNFRSEETRRHDGMAEVEGSKWCRTMIVPSAPPPTTRSMIKEAPECWAFQSKLQKLSLITVETGQENA